MFTERAAAEAPPVPVRLNDGGVPGRLLFKVSVPLTDPCAVGVKVTFTVQLAPTARVEPQLLVWLKPALAVKPEMESVAFPLLVMVIVCAGEVVLTRWVPKLLKPEGEKESAGAVPVPPSETVCGLVPRSSSVMERVPERFPDNVGVNVTLMLQLAFAATAVPHVLVCAKSPLAEIELMFRVAVPVFVSVTVCDALVVPTN